MYRSMAGNTRRYSIAILLLGFGSILAYAPPLLIRATVDSIIGNESLSIHPIVGSIFGLFDLSILRENLWIPGLMLIGSAFLQGTMVFGSGYLAASTSEKSSRNLKDQLFAHINNLPASYHSSAEKGDLLQRCTSDVDTVRKFLALQLVQVGNAFFLVITSLVVTFTVHPGLAVIALPIIPFSIISSILFFGKIQSSFKRSDEAEAALTTLVQEHLTGIRVVRAFGREAHEYQKFGERNHYYRQVTMDLIRWFSAFWASSDIMSLTQVVVVIGVGTLWTVQGTITLGTLLLFISSVWMILWPVRMMGRVLVDMGKAFVAIQRIQGILEVEEEDMQLSGLERDIQGSIRFERVSFSYADGQEILKEISWEVPAGTTVGILGPTGSGKSTMVSLISGLYTPSSGAIFIDGIHIKEYKKECLRQQVAMVLQEPFLFGRSIQQNIGLPLGPDYSQIEIVEAARDANIHQSIIEFERGYETMVGERGVTLSGGQKQRVAIARALVTKAPIMVFDDSLSALDTETDRKVQEAIRKNAQGRTVFLISHRLSTLSKADHILVLQEGRLIQQGSFNELIAEHGMFRRLWKLQTAKE